MLSHWKASLNKKDITMTLAKLDKTWPISEAIIFVTEEYDEKRTPSEEKRSRNYFGQVS